MLYTRLKKWGNSYGIIVPVEHVKKNGFTENEIIEVEIRKRKNPLKPLFGTLTRKRNAQEIKNEIRAGWNE